LIDEIMVSIDVDSIRETVRESLRRSRVDVERVRDEMRRAAERVREETRRAAREHGHGFRRRISRAIDGLWGLTDASGTWTHEVRLAPGRRLVLRNVWGDVRMTASADGILRAHAATRAWGHDSNDAAVMRDLIRIEARDEGPAYVITVEPPDDAGFRRFRVDFEIAVPAGIATTVRQARGDITMIGLDAGVDASTHSGDVSASALAGSAEAETSRGDVALDQVAGDVRVRSRHGDVTLSRVGGRAEAQVLHGDISAVDIRGDVTLHTMSGDIKMEAVAGRVVADSKRGDLALRRPRAALALTMHTTSGDVFAHVDELVAHGTSALSTVSGDVCVQLGDSARCRVVARAASGEIHVEGQGAGEQHTRRSVDTVFGAPDAMLEISTVSGDISVARRIDLTASAPATGV
jgi:hypothetical protein